MSEDLRHHCRRCRAKLTAPVSNPLEGFCCRGCFGYFYKGKCIICEGTKSGRGLACTRPKCQTELRAKKRYGTMGRLLGGTRVKLAPKTSNSIALATAAPRPSPVIFDQDTPPLNLIGGYRFPDAPAIRANADLRRRN